MVNNLKNENDSLNFYKNLGSFSNPKNLLNENHYKKIPDDWYVVITDVKGSTKAIESGQYKDVNVVGVSSIIAVKNSCDETDVPFIFGGDGATIFIPTAKIEKVKKALSVTKKKSIDEFGLSLRVSIIPIIEINKHNCEILIAKMKLSDTATIALAKGNGLGLAEKLTKETDQYELSEQSGYQEEHEGLECRWSPIKSKNGVMLTIIIQATDNNFGIYTEILSDIYNVVPDLGIISIDKLNIDFPPKHYFKEIQMKNNGFRKYLIYFFGLFFVAYQSLIVKFMKKNIAYLNDLTKNTDFIKFDDNLRMVIDISSEQKNSLLCLFEEQRQLKKIYYGTHSSETALMTCFVKSNTDHIHFVDGGSGGYALAAKQLKAMRAAAFLK